MKYITLKAPKNQTVTVPKQETVTEGAAGETAGGAAKVFRGVFNSDKPV